MLELERKLKFSSFICKENGASSPGKCHFLTLVEQQ